MSENLIMDFPILSPGCAVFLPGVSYTVAASQEKGMLEITHSLIGESFIRQLVTGGSARFSVLLLYQSSSERQHEVCETASLKNSGSEIVAKQMIKIKFSYAPEIMPSIVLIKESVISCTDIDSGLDDFWKSSGDITIPKYSRIAQADKLRFTSGELSSLFNVQQDKSLGDGDMKVEVNESAGEVETPVTLLCGQDVYDQLRKLPATEPNVSPKSSSPTESLRLALTTNALCAVYAYMQKLTNAQDSDYEESGVFLAHMELLKEKTDATWHDENFNPSLAATKMLPYMLDAKIMNGDYEDD